MTMDYSSNKLWLTLLAIVAVIAVVFLVFSFSSKQTATNNTSTSTSATSTASTTDIKSQPVQKPGTTPGQSAPTPSGIPNEKLSQYWDLFKQSGKCVTIGSPKGTPVFSFSGEGARVAYDGTSQLVKCAVDGNLYVK